MTTSPETLLDLRITKHFHSRQQDFSMDVSLSIRSEIAVIFGPSGAGKTTILECVAGLLRPDAGHIKLGDIDLLESAVRERRIGYVFQELALFPHMTARENIGYGVCAVSRSERDALVHEALDSFHIKHVAERRPREMSGGERQRVALARSLATKPRVLLLDEPLSALDYETKTGILNDLRTWHASHRIPVLYVTHALEEAFAIGDRVLVLSEGKIVAQGRPSDILAAQRNRLIKELQSGAPL